MLEPGLQGRHTLTSQFSLILGGMGFITAAWVPISPTFPHVSDPVLCPVRLRGRLNWSIQKMVLVSPAPLPPRVLCCFQETLSVQIQTWRESPPNLHPRMMGCVYFSMESIETPVQRQLCYGLLVSKNITRFCSSAPLRFDLLTVLTFVLSHNWPGTQTRSLMSVTSSAVKCDTELGPRVWHGALTHQLSDRPTSQPHLQNFSHSGGCSQS